MRADHLRVSQCGALRVEEVLLALQRLRLALQRHLHALVDQAVVVLADARRQALLLLRVVQQHALLVHPVAQRVPCVVDVHAVAHDRVIQRNHEEHLVLLLLDPAVVPHLLLRVDQRVVQLPRVKPHRIQAIVRVERRGGFHAPQRNHDHVAGRDRQLDRLLEQLLLHQLRGFFGRHHVGSAVERQQLLPILLDQLLRRKRRERIPVQKVKFFVDETNARNDVVFDSTSSGIDTVLLAQRYQIAKRQRIQTVVRGRRVGRDCADGYLFVHRKHTLQRRL